MGQPMHRDLKYHVDEARDYARMAVERRACYLAAWQLTHDADVVPAGASGVPQHVTSSFYDFMNQQHDRIAGPVTVGVRVILRWCEGETLDENGQVVQPYVADTACELFFAHIRIRDLRGPLPAAKRRLLAELKRVNKCDDKNCICQDR